MGGGLVKVLVPAVAPPAPGTLDCSVLLRLLLLFEVGNDAVAVDLA